MTHTLANRPTAKSPKGAAENLLSTFELCAKKLEKLPERDFLQQISILATRRHRLLRTLTKLQSRFDRSNKEPTATGDAGLNPAIVAQRQVSEHLRKLVSQEKLIEPTKFTELMGWKGRAGLSKALTSHRVFFVEVGGSRYYPAFYADPKYTRKQLEATTKLLGDLPGSAKLQFFSTPKGSLGGLSPLAALAEGQFSAVKVTAQGFAER